ncbi:MAG TPA: winged helix-turn-helix transcriptional regulator [Magnetovibrio sp.]
MSDAKDVKGGRASDWATLNLLAALEGGGPVTQRSLAVRIGVALGLTNSLLKRAVRKGLIKASQAPAKRFVYYVTPKGFNEKSRLVAEYLSSSLTFFRQAQEEYANIYKLIDKNNHQNVALYGAGELAEIAILATQAQGLRLRAVIHPGSNLTDASGVPVISSIDDAKALGIDAVVITSVDAPQLAFDTLCEHYDSACIYDAPMLHVSRTALKEGA